MCRSQLDQVESSSHTEEPTHSVISYARNASLSSGFFFLHPELASVGLDVDGGMDTEYKGHGIILRKRI
jgi:hypothetical protein